MLSKYISIVLLFVSSSASLFAEAPPGYYASVDFTTTATMRATLNAIIKNSHRFPYTASGTDTWNVLNAADEDPNNPANILDIYKNLSIPKQTGGNDFYDREHTWPKSYGFPDDVASNYCYTDCHMLFLSDSTYNSTRNNKVYKDCGPTATEEPTAGGTLGIYPGTSNWTNSTGWEVWMGRRGDAARAIFYMDLRYEGGLNTFTGLVEPDMRLTDNEALIDASNTGNNESVAYMGLLSALRRWNLQDPPDEKERKMNDVVYTFQNNRNPFIDHPEWVEQLFQGRSAAQSWALYQ